MTIQGLHHITIVSSNARRTTDFYTQVLGQRLVKRTVNFDDPADRLGTEYREPPAQMIVNNRDEARINATTWPEPVTDITPDMALLNGMHHITAIGTDIQRTHAFFGELLGMRRVKITSNFDNPNSAHWYWGVGDGRPGTLITYFERDPRTERRMRMGAGQTHHFALAVPDEDTQLQWR